MIKLNKFVILLMGVCFSFCQCGQISMNINNGQFNISYYSNSSCDPIASSNVGNNIKCLMLCQMTNCKFLLFDGSSSNCTLFGSNPSLITYGSVSGLNLNYILGNRSLIYIIISTNLYLLSLFYNIKIPIWILETLVCLISLVTIWLIIIVLTALANV